MLSKSFTFCKLIDTIPVSVRYKSTNVTHHQSLVHLWNDWYTEYLTAEFPRLIIRLEDMMFHAPEVITKVCECGGGTMRKKFHYTLGSAKGSGGPHKGANGLVSAIVKYSDEAKRVEGFTKDDLDFARSKLNKNLMDTFGYRQP